MNHEQDDAIEALLRKQFDGAIPDDGFSERVMQQLPARRRRIAWPLWVGLAAGAGGCWLSLTAAPLMRVGWHDWTHGELSPSTVTLLLAMAGMSLLACWWTIAEADDR